MQHVRILQSHLRLNKLELRLFDTYLYVANTSAVIQLPQKF